MQILLMEPALKYFIWAPLALTGPDLVAAENQLLEIQGSRIASMQTVRKSDLPASVTDHPRFTCLAEGQTLMPALIDGHVHLALDGEDFKQARAAWDRPHALEGRIRRALEEMTRSGIGAVRDGGDCRAINLEARALVSEGRCKGPRIVATGRAVREKGGYGTFLGPDYGSRESIPAVVEQALASGADQLKVVVSGVVSFIEYGLVKGLLMEPDSLRRLTACARERGLKVMAHASSAEAVEMAIAAGVNSIEHGYFVNQAGLQGMAERQVAWVPTVIPVAVQAREPLSSLRTPLEIEVITATCKGQAGNLTRALQLGVPLGAGTDSGAAGVGHAHSLIEELLLYRAGGLSNRQVLKAATIANAGILGLEKEYGQVERGYRAALIAVRGNPLQDLNILKTVTFHALPR